MDKKTYLKIYTPIDSKFQTVASAIADSLGVGFIPGPLKTWESASRKAKADRVEVTQLKDLIRCSFVVETVSELECLHDTLRQHFPVVAVKNRLKEPGYRDIKINVQFEGIVCEVQLHTALGLAAKDGFTINHPMVNRYSKKMGWFAGIGHKLYEIERVSRIPVIWRLLGIGYYKAVRAIF